MAKSGCGNLNLAKAIGRDLDRIVERLKAEMPSCEIDQLQVVHPGGDDNGLWFINVPGQETTVQIESSYGDCPFLIESDFDNQRVEGRTVDEVVGTVKRLLSFEPQE